MYDYMYTITNTQHNGCVVFFVPDNLDTFHPESITRNKMLWLLSKLYSEPEILRNVVFVFGAYKYFPDSVFNNSGAEMLKKYLSIKLEQFYPQAENIRGIIENNIRVIKQRRTA